MDFWAALEATEMWSWLWQLNSMVCPKQWNDEHSHRVSVLTEPVFSPSVLTKHERSVWTWLWLRESIHPALSGWTYQSPQGVQCVLRLLMYKLITKCLTGHVTHFPHLMSKRYTALKWLAQGRIQVASMLPKPKGLLSPNCLSGIWSRMLLPADTSLHILTWSQSMDPVLIRTGFWIEGVTLQCQRNHHKDGKGKTKPIM